jgi:parvulin-like peptidyl-prolyl isomerase
MNNQVRTAASAALCAFLLLLPAGCGSDKGVAAKVDGKRIFIREVEDMIQRYAAINRKLNPAYMEPKGLVLENMRRQFLDGLIDKLIILKKSGELKISVAPEELTAKIAELKRTNEILDEDSFNRYLREQNISEEQFRNNIRDIMLMEKTRDKFFSDITAADSEAQAYYKAHAASYAREIVRASHILLMMPDKDNPAQGVLTVETKLKKQKPGLSGDALKKAVNAECARILAKAETVAKEAKAGGDFAGLARKYSEDATGKSGGDLGVVNRGMLRPEIDQMLFSLKNNEAAGPVKTSLGYHILKAFSDPKKEVRPFEEVKSDIVNDIVLEKRKAKLKSLRDKVKIRILWDYKS